MGIPAASKQFELNSQDMKQWLLNILKYDVPPIVLVFLYALSAGKDWKSAMLVVYAAALQAAISIVDKFIAGNKV